MKPKKTTTRELYLAKASSLTAGTRDETYGDPRLTMKVQQELLEIIKKYNRHTKLGYEACLSNIAQKLARALVGPQPGSDTFVDIAAYSAMAGEIMYPREEN